MRRSILAVVFVAAAVLGVGGKALAEPGPNGRNDYGLCKAYFAGSERGREEKRKAPPFQALEEAAEAQDQTVEEFCANATPGGR